MNKDEHILAEYKHISDAIMDIDRRIVQVFTGIDDGRGCFTLCLAGRLALPKRDTQK
jgi:hypothetical protein